MALELTITPKQLSKYVFLANIALCIAVGWHGLALAQFDSQPEATKKIALPTTDKAKAVSQLGSYREYGVIGQRISPPAPVLKRPSKPTKPTVSKPAPKPATSLELISTITDQTMPLAFINVKVRNGVFSQKLVYEGDSVGGFVVKSIKPGLVNLSKNGKDVPALKIKAIEFADGNGLGAATGLAPLPGERLVQAVDSKIVNNLRKNPMQLVTDLSPIPYFKNGKLVGMKITRMPKKSIFAQRGMKINDVIKSINGIPADVKNAYKLFDQLPNAKKFNIQLLRNGTVINKSFKIQ